MKYAFIGIIFFMFLIENVTAQGDYIGVGLGPSLLYADNSGQYRKMRFQTLPALTAMYNYQFTDFLSVRASVGSQMLNSGNYYDGSRKAREWGRQGQAFGFSGFGYYGDIMPVIITNPDAIGRMYSQYQFYFGAGLGYMLVDKTVQVLEPFPIETRPLTPGTVVTSPDLTHHLYVPVRTGVSTNLGGDWEFAVEFTMMIGLDSNVDSQNMQWKLIPVDIMGQAQFVVRRYVGPVW